MTDLLLAWFVPSLGALLLGLEIYRGQRDVAAERDRAPRPPEPGHRRRPRPVDRRRPSLLTLARQTQDLIFRTRCAQTRVPSWFFRRFHAADRVDFQAAMANLADLLRARPPAARAD